MNAPSERRPSRSRALPLALLFAPLFALTMIVTGATYAVAPDVQAADWSAWVDSEQGFLIELPPGHALAPAGGQWFLHGFHDGEPTVPDATITFLAGRDLPRALKESFPVDARAEPLTFGDAGTTGLRVTSVYRTPDGDPYEESGYLIEAPAGVYRIGRYESFDWAPFDAAARSFRLVRLVGHDARD